MIDLVNSAKIRKFTAQFFRYGMVGIVSNLTGYLLFLIITFWGIGPKAAMTLLYVVGATIGFLGNRQWTFSHHGTLLGSGSRYFVAHCFGYLINFIILFTFVDVLGFSHQWVQAIAIFIVAGFLFMAFKYFVFPVDNNSERLS